jgi:hypothetical protein
MDDDGRERAARRPTGELWIGGPDGGARLLGSNPKKPPRVSFVAGYWKLG